jgi:hypothetical protein
MEKPKDLGPHTRKYHHAVATASDTSAEAEDPGLHITMNHHGTVIAQNTGEEADDPNRLDMRTTMKKTKSRWGSMLYP